jgi:hypothetical protein
MAKDLTAYMTDVLPGHEARRMRGAGPRRLSRRTVVARFDKVEEASRAAEAVLTEARQDDVELVAIVPPEHDHAVGSGDSVISESVAQVSTGRVTTWAIAGGLIGSLAGLVVGLSIADEVVVGVLATVAGFLIGAVVGATFGGVGRFGGEHAWEEAPRPLDDAVGGVLAVHAHDEESARQISRRIKSCTGAMDIRVLDEDGFWHTPAVDD